MVKHNKFNEVGLEKPPKKIRSGWLWALNLLKNMRLHDIFFIGYSKMNYSSSKTVSFLLSFGNKFYYSFPVLSGGVNINLNRIDSKKLIY